MQRPELVLPAGDLEKLKTALLFGADAVYLGGKDFNLRAFAGNLTIPEMATGLEYAHTLGKKVYITVNILAHNRDIKRLPPYLEELQQLGVDGLIISDPGVMRLAKKYASSIPVTISTQANVSNYESAAFYQDMGAFRVVLARELTLDEIADIKRQVEIELEIFVHGAMCVSYSGRCLLSHYMAGRNANQGACAHPCRYKYSVVEEKRPGQYYAIEEDERGSYIFNSRDLCLLEYLPQLIDVGVNAFKVEGRMKSPLYVASVARIYRQAIEVYVNQGYRGAAQESQAGMEELWAVATRPFTNGFIEGESPLIQDINRQEMPRRTDFCGMVNGYNPDRRMVEIEQRNNFGPGDLLQFMIPDGRIIDLQLRQLFDAEGNLLDRARHPRQKVFIPFDQPVHENSILRRVGERHEE
ncbi:MAG: peptidase U32 [Firmicutes bacterium HGW-Firmicutes-15]|nr:MAG: peptidase U32 [Firmicutes bacterium HGW-Firmicutes-15]